MEDTITMLESSFWIMVFGMVIVFMVLMVLIYSVELTHKIISKSKYGKTDDTVPPSSTRSSNDNGRNAAIAAAVNKYRSEK